MSLLLRLYKIVCIVTAFLMVGYWFYKFQKNEDKTIIEIKSEKRIGKIPYPEVTFCIRNPFLNEKLAEASNDLDSKTYLKYLKGDVLYNDSYANIKFDQVTLNLHDYIEDLEFKWKNVSIDNCTNTQNCRFVIAKNNFNGFANSDFYRCFALELNPIYAKDVGGFNVVFNSKLENILPQIGDVYIGLNYPQQFYRSYGMRQIWRKSGKSTTTEFIEIISIEVLKRRNKRTAACNDDRCGVAARTMPRHSWSGGTKSKIQRSGWRSQGTTGGWFIVRGCTEAIPRRLR